MGCPQHVVTLHQGIVKPLGMSHAGIDHRFERAAQGCLVDFDPKTLDHTGFGEPTHPFGHGVGGEMHPVAKHLP